MVRQTQQKTTKILIKFTLMKGKEEYNDMQYYEGHADKAESIGKYN